MLLNSFSPLVIYTQCIYNVESRCQIPQQTWVQVFLACFHQDTGYQYNNKEMVFCGKAWSNLIRTRFYQRLNLIYNSIRNTQAFALLVQSMHFVPVHIARYIQNTWHYSTRKLKPLHMLVMGVRITDSLDCMLFN